jgi:hypothetical protein
LPLLVLSAALVSRSQPRLVVRGGDRISLDTLYEGRTEERTLTLFNSGTDTLRVRNITTSCGCTVAKVSDKRIPPGDSVRLAVSFDSKDVSGDIVRHVYIKSNDPVRDSLNVTFTGTIRTIIVAKPRYLSFGKVLQNDTAVKAIELLNTTNHPIRILSDSIPDPRISLQLASQVLYPHAADSLFVMFRPDTPEKLLGQIELRTDDAMKPLMKISYVGEVRRKR